MEDSQNITSAEIFNLQRRWEKQKEPRQKLSRFWQARIEDALGRFMWNLEHSTFEPGQHDLSKC